MSTGAGRGIADTVLGGKRFAENQLIIGFENDPGRTGIVFPADFDYSLEQGCLDRLILRIGFDSKGSAQHFDVDR